MSTPPDFGREAWRLVIALLEAEHESMLDIARDFELVPGQLKFLHALLPGVSMPMAALAAAAHCDPSMVTRTVEKLVARGLVERRESESDRRAKEVRLTEAGVHTREAVVARFTAPPPSIQALSAADQEALVEVLRRALANAEARRVAKTAAPAVLE